MFKLRLGQLHPRHWNVRLVWDVFMVYVALINVGLIVFDLTYLLLRPQYQRYLPVLTRVYDPVLAIEKHPLTDSLLDEARQTEQLLALDPGSPGLVARVERLRHLTLRVVRENPFERSRQTRTLEVIKLVLGKETGRDPLGFDDAQPLAATVDLFWVDDPQVLRRRLDLFDQNVRPLLEVNYHREVNLNGSLVDHFWLIDLPFLTLFLGEFLIRWSLAVRRREYTRWFFFPIFNWYDLLGLIPYTQFRVFRLFRVASIYMRLRRSEVTRVGKDVLSRAIAYVSNIIAEEISDAVSLRILNETQQEIRDDTHARIFDSTIVARRHEIEEVTVKQIRQLVASEPIRQRIRQLLRVNLDKAVESSEALRAVPLPAAVLRPLVRGVGQVLLETTLESVAATLESEEGREAACELVGSILEQVLSGPLRSEVDSLSKSISVEVIEEMKQAVSVKKWATADRDDGDVQALD